MERKLVAILSADVQGYSRLMGEDEEATIRTLTAYREMITRLVQQHRGRVVDSPGDNLLAEFASAVDAVQGAMTIQQALKTRNAELPVNRQMHYRIGVNVGDVVVEGERIYGDGVNIAARLESLAEGGGICISGNVHEQVENKLDIGFSYLGEQTVKNIAKPVRVYRVELSAEVSAALVSGEPPAALPLPDKPSIAVLPFTNMSNDPEQEYFSDGMTDDIITDLSKISGLFVIARNSTFTYKGRAVTIPDVGWELGVHHVLEGSVRKAGNRVRINVQLIDAPTGGHIWAERYDRELADIFELQDEITRKIVFALKVKLSPEERERFRHAPTTNLDAYEAYLHAVEIYWRGAREANGQARRWCEQALSLDSHYAAAYAVLGYTYFTEWVYQWSQETIALEQAYELAQQAVTLDETLALAHRIVGELVLWRDRDYRRAFSEVERAIALNPNDAEAYDRLGAMLCYTGQAEEAIEAVRRAMRLNPHYPHSYPHTLGRAYYVSQRYAEAKAALKLAVSRNAEALPSHLLLAAVYRDLDQEEDARREADIVRQISPQLSLSFVSSKFPYKDPALLARFLTALRKAGLE